MNFEASVLLRLNRNPESDNFEPGYFLLDCHRSTTFQDLKIGLSYLKRKVGGKMKVSCRLSSQNVSSIQDIFC